MIFPLTPVVDESGAVDVRFDHRARPLCPILRDGLRGVLADLADPQDKAKKK